MTFMEMFNLIRRNLIIFLLTALICLGAGLLAQKAFLQMKYENSIFLVFGVEDRLKGGDPYENLQAADQITESIQGWIKDPSFQKEIAGITGNDFSIKAKKQEKNNLLITFNTADLTANNSYKEAILSLLNQKISVYNNNSDLQINLASQTYNLDENRYLPAVVLMLAGLFGLLIGVIFSYLYEKMTGKVSFLKEISFFFSTVRPFSFKNEKHLKTGFPFLYKHLMSDNPGNQLQILHFSTPSKVLQTMFSEQENIKGVTELCIPDNLQDVRIDLPTVLICQPGATPRGGLDYLSELNFSRLEIVVFDRLKSQR